MMKSAIVWLRSRDCAAVVIDTNFKQDIHKLVDTLLTIRLKYMANINFKSQKKYFSCQ